VPLTRTSQAVATARTHHSRRRNPGCRGRHVPAADL